MKKNFFFDLEPLQKLFNDAEIVNQFLTKFRYPEV